MSPLDTTTFDNHLDWIIGLLVALTVLELVAVVLLGSILGLLKKWREERYLGDDLPGSNRAI